MATRLEEGTLRPSPTSLKDEFACPLLVSFRCIPLWSLNTYHHLTLSSAWNVFTSLPGLHPESLPYLLTDQHLLSTHCALGSTLGAWESLAIRVTQDVPRFVPISTKRAREKVEKGGQLPNAQLISLLGQCLLGRLQPGGKGPLQRKQGNQGQEVGTEPVLGRGRVTREYTWE